MIELFDGDIHEEGRQSSKGNQLKWFSGDTWYKADYTGYEGLAEYVVSALLQKSCLAADDFVCYETEQISYHGKVFNGCRSRNFLKTGEQLITLERLFQNQYGASLYRSLFQIEDVNERASFLVSQVEQMTGLRNFGVYLDRMLAIDAVFLNEDRHTHNIGVILKEDGSYRLCPYFDHGASLLSDTTLDYPIGGDVYKLIASVQSKTLSMDFQEQLDAVEDRYGIQMTFDFTKQDVRRVLQEEPYYPDEVKRRVETVIYEQMRTYAYLMKGYKIF